MVSKAKGKQDAASNKERIERQNKVRDRLADLIAEDPLAMASEMGNLSIAILAERFPPKLSTKEKQRIKENYSGATDALIAERAMAVEGVLVSLALCVMMGRITLDYFPDSNVQAAVTSDNAVGPAVMKTLAPELEAIFKRGMENGMSPFGVGTSMILIGALTAVQNGVHWSAMVRTLLESVDNLTDQASPVSEKEFEEKAMSLLMEQMGISRAEAKKYLAYAKKLKTKEE